MRDRIYFTRIAFILFFWGVNLIVSGQVTGLSKITSSVKTVSLEELLFMETSPGSMVFTTHDSIAFGDEIVLGAEPVDPAAQVTFIKQADPQAGASDTAIFNITSADGSNTSTYMVVVARSVYHCKIGFLNYGSSAKPENWTGGGGIFATGSQGQYGLYPGENGFRMYRSSNTGPGRLASPEFSSAATLTFAAKFSKTVDESLEVSMSKDGGASWTILETFTPADGRIPSYAGESIEDTLAMQTIVINESSPVMIQFSYVGTSTTPRTMLDDVGLTAVKGVGGFPTIRINGESLKSFDIDVLDMMVDVPDSVSAVTVTPDLGSGWIVLEVVQPVDISGTEEERTATVSVKSSDGADERTYTLLFNPIPPLDLFFALGQSNMAGRAPILPEVTDTMIDVRLFDDLYNWTPAVNPMNQYSNIRKDLSMQKVGPSYAFVKTVSAHADRDIGIAVNARGGTAIAAFARGEYRDPMFSRLRETKKFGEVKAIIWHQGESDNSKANAYMEDLKLLVGDLRTEFGNAYFLAGQMGGWNAEGESTPKYEAINQVISTIGDHISDADFVTNEDLGHIGDYSHFNLASQILLGQRYAQKVLKTVYDVEISILNVDMKGEGFAVFAEDTIVKTRSWSYTTLKGGDRTIEIYPEPGEVITSLVINGVEVTDIAGASSYSYPVSTSENSRIVIELVSGFPENISERISDSGQQSGIIFPNPVKEKIYIRTESNIESVEIYTLKGERIHHSSEHKQVDVSALAAGSYLVRVSTEGAIVFSMLIKI